MEKNKLPSFSRVLVEEILLNRMPNNDYWYFFLLAQYMISKVLCSNRVYIESEKIDTRNAPPNIYAMLFSESGVGKGRSHKILKDCMKEYSLDIKTRALEYVESEKNSIEMFIKIENLTKGQAGQYRNEHSPRFIKQEIDSNATLEGFLDSRTALQGAKFGCSCWEDSEIYDTMKGLERGDRNSKEFVKYNKEAYDHGFSEAKIIKSNKKPQDIEGVPHLVCLHGAIDEDEDTTAFKTFFDLGFARRCMVFYNNDKHTNKIEMTEEMVNNAIESEKYAVQLFKDLNNKFKPLQHVEYPHNRIAIIPDSDTEKRYMDYVKVCASEASKLRGSHTKGVRTEIANRPWKALKLAVVLFCQDISEDTARQQKYTMPVSYFLLAEEILEIYGNQFKSFYLSEGMALEEKVLDYILEKKFVSKSELTTSNILAGSYTQRSSTVYNLIDRNHLSDYLETKGYKLVVSEAGKTKKALYYSIEEMPKEEPIEETLIVHFSQSETNDNYATEFLAKETPFTKLHEFIQQDKNYSPSCFNGNYRRGENWRGDNDLIVLDCDNEVEEVKNQLTIEMVKQQLKDYTFLIMPTKSHNKEKKGDVRERFRIIIPTYKMENIDLEEHKKLLTNIVKELGLSFSYSKKIDGKDKRFSWVDVSCFEASKKYTGYNSEPHYNKGKLLNWKLYISEKPKYPKKGTFTEGQEQAFKNPFDKNTVLEIKGRPMTFNEYSYLAQQRGKTVPCKCPFHEDKNPSAFIDINKHGHFQFTCTPCGINQFCKI
jgi:hypothetical protein